MTCPECSGEMTEAQRGGVSVPQCSDCSGIFLRRIDLADLVDGESAWHVTADRRAHTQPLPRISPDMSAPPASTSPTRSARAYIDVLFG